jgi:hypothetical protein
MQNNDTVVDKFLKHEIANSTNLHSDSVVLKSYDMVIAQWFTNGTLYIHLDRCPSKTTTMHRNKLIRRCEVNGTLYANFPKND